MMTLVSVSASTWGELPGIVTKLAPDRLRVEIWTAIGRGERVTVTFGRSHVPGCEIVAVCDCIAVHSDYRTMGFCRRLTLRVVAWEGDGIFPARPDDAVPRLEPDDDAVID